MFVPGHEGMSKLWCPQCLQIGSQMTFYAHQTSDMIRNIYTSYVDTDLPSEVKLILKQFAREVVQQLGEEL
jgi:hypothetical protein